MNTFASIDWLNTNRGRRWTNDGEPQFNSWLVEALDTQLRDRLRYAEFWSRDHWPVHRAWLNDGEMIDADTVRPKIGTTIQIRLPMRFKVDKEFNPLQSVASTAVQGTFTGDT